MDLWASSVSYSSRADHLAYATGPSPRRRLVNVEATAAVNGSVDCMHTQKALIAVTFSI